MINWMTTNNSMTGSYCLSKNVTRVTSHHLYYSICSQCPPPARTQVRRPWCHSTSAHSITVWLSVVAHSLLMHCFSSSTSKILVWWTLLTYVKEVTDFQWFSGLTMTFWAGMLYPVWIHCCKRPNYDFCISQGSVATVLRLGGQNWGRLCPVSSRCCTPKIIKFCQCFTELFTK